MGEGGLLPGSTDRQGEAGDRSLKLGSPALSRNCKDGLIPSKPGYPPSPDVLSSFAERMGYL